MTNAAALRCRMLHLDKGLFLNYNEHCSVWGFYEQSCDYQRGDTENRSGSSFGSRGGQQLISGQWLRPACVSGIDL